MGVIFLNFIKSMVELSSIQPPSVDSPILTNHSFLQIVCKEKSESLEGCGFEPKICFIKSYSTTIQLWELKSQRYPHD